MERFAFGWSSEKVRARELNHDILQRLIDCKLAGTCGVNETQIVVAASMHFGKAPYGGQSGKSGEDIW